MEGSNDIMSDKFKFDVVIGNPPYQDETVGNNRDVPIYNYFMDEAYDIAEKVSFITPARFLFNAGQTPRAWNEKMLSDSHLKVEFFEQKSANVFSGTDIKGGVAITYHDNATTFGEIGTFIVDGELRDISQKVRSHNDGSISEIHHNRSSYRLTEALYNENPELSDRSKVHNDTTVGSNIFDKLPEIFSDSIPSGSEEYARVFGRQDNGRSYKWTKKKYIADHPNLDKWKVFVAKSNGTGAFGETFSPLEVAEPGTIPTQTFISFGAFSDKAEAEALKKYISGKFARALLDINKATPDNARKQVWEHVPMQNLTNESDIDWTQTIDEIDKMLYSKYGLSPEEVDYIEINVREMN